MVLLGLLQKPYVFAFAVVVATAALAWLYARTTVAEGDKPGAARSTFFRTLLAGALASAALTYAASFGAGGDAPLAAEPFDTPLGEAVAPGSAGGF